VIDSNLAKVAESEILNPYALLVGVLAVGLAIVLIHTTFVYFLFRGKVELESGPVTPPR
jgi:cytochrome bd-type quinol oxidase subunit 2